MPEDLPLPDMPERESANEVLLQLRPILTQIPTQELVRVRLSPDRAWEQVRDVHHRFTELIPLLAEEYSEARCQRVLVAYQQVPDLAMAYIAADLQLELAKRRKKSPELLTLEKEIREAHALLTEWVRKVFAEHPEEAGLVKRLLAGRGANNAAKDLVGFCALFERQKAWLDVNEWWPVLRRHGITDDSLRTYDKMATRWILLSGEPNAIPDGVLLRSRAYLAMERAYRELIRSARDLRPEEDWSLLNPKMVRSKRKPTST